VGIDWWATGGIACSPAAVALLVIYAPPYGEDPTKVIRRDAAPAA
jgi:hypothetical protein